MSTDSDIIFGACQTLRNVWAIDWQSRLGPLTQSAELLILGIVRGENNFGHSSGFEGSHNWGSLRCFRHDFGCIQHGDLDANGNPLVAGFQKYPSEEEGARGFLNTLLGHHKAVVPIQDGSAQDVAAAMYANGYYTGVHGVGNPDANIADYAHMIQSNASHIASVLGSTAPPPSSGGLGSGLVALLPLVLIAAGSAAAYAYFNPAGFSHALALATRQSRALYSGAKGYLT